MLDYPLLLIFPIAMMYAAVMDFFTMKIPNRISLTLIIGFFIATIAGGMGWQDILRHAGAGILVLLITIAMFSQGWMGGGDAKLLSAAALWIGFSHLLDYVFVTALFGGILGILILTYRSFIPPVMIAGRDWAERLHDKKAGIPYGVALGAAALWVFPSSDVFKALSI